MFKINNKATRELNKVKIGEYDLENIGLFLKKDYIFTYTITKEVEEKWIPGRDMPYHKHIRNLPIDLEIEFNIMESVDFNVRYKKIVDFINGSKEKILTLNNENKGFRIYYTSIGNITRGIGSDKIIIKFSCYPDIVSV